MVNSRAFAFNRAAAYNSTNCGVALSITSTSPAYLIDRTPENETSYYASFAFHPNAITMAEGTEHPIFRAYRPDGTAIMTVDFRFSGGLYHVRAGLGNDLARWSYTPWATLGSQWNVIEVGWRGASAPGSNNGGLLLTLNGTRVAAGSGIDNDQQRMDWVQLGAIRNLSASTLGTYFFDEFSSRRTWPATVSSADAPAGLHEEETLETDYDEGYLGEHDEGAEESPASGSNYLYLPQMNR
jgi:hypothetical protein